MLPQLTSRIACSVKLSTRIRKLTPFFTRFSFSLRPSWPSLLLCSPYTRVGVSRARSPERMFRSVRTHNRGLNLYDRWFCHSGKQRWLYVSDLTVSLPPPLDSPDVALAHASLELTTLSPTEKKKIKTTRLEWSLRFD